MLTGSTASELKGRMGVGLSSPCTLTAMALLTLLATLVTLLLVPGLVMGSTCTSS